MNNTTLLFEGSVFFTARPTKNHPGYEDLMAKVKTADGIIDITLYGSAGGSLSKYTKGDKIFISSVLKEDGNYEYRLCEYAIPKNPQENHTIVAQQICDIYNNLISLKIPEDAAKHLTSTVYIQAGKLT